MVAGSVVVAVLVEEVKVKVVVATVVEGLSVEVLA